MIPTSDPPAVDVFVAGSPISKLRHRYAVAGHGGSARRVQYTPAATAAWERQVGLQVQCLRQPPRALLEGPLAVSLEFTLPIPASWSRGRREAAHGRWHATRPDLDNLVKAVKDGLSGLVYADDRSIARIEAAKRYGEQPGVHVRIWPLNE